MKNYNNDKSKLIGERIAEMRKFKGISLEEMAMLLDITVEQLMQYENGVSEIYPDMLLNISIVLNVEINDFFKYLYLKFA